MEVFEGAGCKSISVIADTVEPRPVDIPPLWTPHPCGHFLPGPFVFLVCNLWPTFSVTLLKVHGHS